MTLCACFVPAGIHLNNVAQPTLRFFLLLDTNEDILKNVGNQTAEGSHSIFVLYNGSQWLPSTHFLQNVFFCVQQKNETRTGLEQVEGENDD